MSDAEQLRKEIFEKVAAYYDLVHAPKPFSPGERIGYAGRVYDADELTHAVDASLEFWLTAGRYAQQFESQFASYLGVKFCALANSGSSANWLAFMALTSPQLKEKQVKRGDEMITVALGFPTTITPALLYGVVPVFVDVCPTTYNIDCTQLEAALSPRTKVVMVAHALGNPFDVKQVKSFCDQHGLWMIEDNCDALGSTVDGQLTGTFGHLGTSSFYPPHHLTMGEGGAVYTSHALLARVVNSFRDWGRDCWCDSGKDNTCKTRFSKQYGSLPFGYDHKYVYSHLGQNLKATDIQAAIGCAQLKKLPGFIQKRKENFQFLYNRLSKLSDFFVLPEATANSDPSWFGFPLTVKKEAPFSRLEIVTALEKLGIQTRSLFAGNITRHPCFEGLIEGKDYRVATALTHTDTIMADGFWFGVYPGLSHAQLTYMAEAIESFVTQQKGDQS